jgi:hypothetical protein
MGLSDDQLTSIRRSSDEDLVRYAQSEDMASIVESNLRLKNSNEWLSKVLIVLTIILVFLTAPLVGIEIYHLAAPSPLTDSPDASGSSDADNAP